MWNFLSLGMKPAPMPGATENGTIPLARIHYASIGGSHTLDILEEAIPPGHEIFTGYTSDQTEYDMDDADSEDEPEDGDMGRPPSKDSVNCDTITSNPTKTPTLPISTPGIAERKHCCATAEGMVPPLKHQKGDTPIHVQCNGRKNKLRRIRHELMEALEKQINSIQSGFEGGSSGLQACRACTIHIYLHMVVWNDCPMLRLPNRLLKLRGLPHTRGAGRFACGHTSGLGTRTFPNFNEENTSNSSHYLKTPISAWNCICMFNQTNGPPTL